MNRAPAARHRDGYRGGGAVLAPSVQPRLGNQAQGKSDGTVTAEFAVVLPAVILLLALLLAAAASGVTQLRLEEAARAGARALARGEDPAAVEGIVRTLAGPSATATLAAEGEWLSINVADRVGGPLGAAVPWTLTAKATTRSETRVAQSGRVQPVRVHQPEPVPQEAWT